MHIPYVGTARGHDIRVDGEAGQAYRMPVRAIQSVNAVTAAALLIACNPGKAAMMRGFDVWVAGMAGRGECRLMQPGKRQGQWCMGAAVKFRAAGAYARLGALLLGWLLLAVAHAADSSEVSIQIQGVSPELHDNIASYVGKVSQDELSSWRNTRVRVSDSVRDALQSQGYYSPDYQIERQAEGINIMISPGEPVRVRQLNLVFRGDAGNDIAFTALREHMPLKVGDAFHHGKYESLKNEIQVLATEHGYFDGEWTQREANVYVPERQVDIELIYDSGPRYVFGAVSFLDKEGKPQSVVTPALMQKFLTFEEGQPYEADKVIKLNRSMLNSRFFSDVRVHVQREKAEGNEVPVDVVVAAERPNNVDLGIGYSTDFKARISAKWLRP
ncbi:MAG: autotransporter assembly complex protein TamA, partial [Moraxellaceae bacterium]